MVIAALAIPLASAHPAQRISNAPPGPKLASPGVPKQGNPPSPAAAPPATVKKFAELQRTVAAKPERSNLGNLRDPFRIPPPPPPPELRAAGGAAQSAAGPHPPGVRGLSVEQLHLRGTIKQESTGTMIAMVTSDTNLAYFLRPGEQLYDGLVTRISPGALYLRERLPGPGQQVQWRDVVLKLAADSAESR